MRQIVSSETGSPASRSRSPWWDRCATRPRRLTATVQPASRPSSTYRRKCRSIRASRPGSKPTSAGSASTLIRATRPTLPARGDLVLRRETGGSQRAVEVGVAQHPGDAAVRDPERRRDPDGRREIAGAPVDPARVLLDDRPVVAAEPPQRLQPDGRVPHPSDQKPATPT